MYHGETFENVKKLSSAVRYTRRQINLYRMFFADFSVNHQKIFNNSKVRPFDM